MGNCLKSAASIDDLALLREGSGSGRLEQTNSSEQLGPPPSYHETMQVHHQLTSNNHPSSTLHSHQSHAHSQSMSLPVFYPSPNVSRPASQLSEEEQIKIAQRIGLIQHLPIGLYDGSKKNRECAICMCEFVINDSIRFLPCMHIYHSKCIDDWLMRSFTCPSCMEPVDAALLSTYQTE
ncbi:RING finger protein 11-like [Panonychus citri]|uniref:RING finger protein 11-like n=1 Tax=Panonychus citri TaxID=50023 RepID=UPI00230807FA|nr:RING finger protein 11-like [Panonychus citri]